MLGLVCIEAKVGKHIASGEAFATRCHGIGTQPTWRQQGRRARVSVDEGSSRRAHYPFRVARSITSRAQAFRLRLRWAAATIAAR